MDSESQNNGSAALRMVLPVKRYNAYLPHALLFNIFMPFFSVHAACLNKHLLAYDLPSLPHTGEYELSQTGQTHSELPSALAKHEA